MSALTTSHQHFTRGFSHCNKATTTTTTTTTKVFQIAKEEVKLSLFTDDMIIMCRKSYRVNKKATSTNK